MRFISLRKTLIKYKLMKWGRGWIPYIQLSLKNLYFPSGTMCMLTVVLKNQF